MDLIVYLDTTNNVLKLENGKAMVKAQLKDSFDKNLDNMIENYKTLPQVLVKYGPYVNVLREARQLFVEDKFYSCIIICGTAAELIAKDMLKNNLFLKKEDNYILPEEEIGSVLDRIDFETVRRLLLKTDLVGEDIGKAFKDLSELRNIYAHAANNSNKDKALQAIKDLHLIIDGTISVFKDYEIRDGKLVKKSS